MSGGGAIEIRRKQEQEEVYYARKTYLIVPHVTPKSICLIVTHSK